VEGGGEVGDEVDMASRPTRDPRRRGGRGWRRGVGIRMGSAEGIGFRGEEVAVVAGGRTATGLKLKRGWGISDLRQRAARGVSAELAALWRHVRGVIAYVNTPLLMRGIFVFCPFCRKNYKCIMKMGKSTT
jgi:hypothetical protein